MCRQDRWHRPHATAEDRLQVTGDRAQTTAEDRARATAEDRPLVNEKHRQRKKIIKGEYENGMVNIWIGILDRAQHGTR